MRLAGAAAFVIAACIGNAVGATPENNTEENLIYSGFGDPNCTGCHSGIGTQFPCNLGAYGQALGAALGEQCGNGTKVVDPNVIRAAILSLQQSYMPRVAQPGGPVAGAAASLQLTVDPGSTRTGARASLSPMVSFTQDGVGASLSGETVTLSFAGIALTDRGARRRAGLPFRIALPLRNDAIFQATTVENRLLNTVEVSFANIAPVAAADTFSTADNAALSGNVLVQGLDTDPDGGTLTAVSSTVLRPKTAA
jgi:cadherin-like protein